MPDDAILAVMQKEFGGPKASPQQTDAPWYQKLGRAADDMVRIGANAMTFGYADKIAGRMGGEGIEAERAKTNAARERAGGAGIVADVGGGLATGLGLAGAGLTTARLVPKGLAGLTGLGARTAAMGAEGAAYGAANALGNDQDVGTGALIGAGAGAAGNLAGEGLSRAVGSIAGAFNKQPKVPTIDQVRAAKDAAYKAADDAGVVYTPQAIDRLMAEVQQKLADRAYSPKLQPRVQPSLDELERLQGQNVTMKGMDTVRQMASDAFDPMNKRSGALGSKIIDKIDDLIASPQAGDVLMGDAAAGAAAIAEARKLNTQASKYDRVVEALTKAERRAASTGSGGNADNATRQNIRAILDNPKKSRGFTADERAAMETIVRGTPTQNALRLAGKLSPSGNGLMAALGLGATAANPVMAAAPAAGMLAKALADKGTAKNTDDLLRVILAGGNKSAAFAPPNAVQRLAESKREALIRALMMGGIVATPRPAEAP